MTVVAYEQLFSAYEYHRDGRNAYLNTPALAFLAGGVDRCLSSMEIRVHRTLAPIGVVRYEVKSGILFIGIRSSYR